MENYVKDDFGVIHQVKKNEFFKDYGVERNNYGEVSNYLSYLRLGFIQGTLPVDNFSTVLDVGFGNGDFLRACQKYFKVCAGYDLFYDYLPEGCVKEESLHNNYYDVVTFFDSLEHFDDIKVLDKIKCKYVVISVPNCISDDPEWFMNWKHRRPDEHLHHFSANSLCLFLNSQGYSIHTISYFEDTIRKSPGVNNILTVVAEKI
jgi:hypothetical protein